jgi:polyisoprenoid-binding protein YceI
MKKMIVLLAVFTTLLSFRTADAGNWTVDKAHAKLGFTITHMQISEVEGAFKSFDATITGSKDDFSDAVVELTADVNSVSTDNEKRDVHIKSADFFDAAKYPTMTFKSTGFTKTGERKYKVTGNLTLHGVTKPVEMEATYNTAVNPMSKKQLAGFKVTATINRTDFGVGTSSAMLSDEVHLIANAEFIKN